jgi:hypothetical protein
MSFEPSSPSIEEIAKHLQLQYDAWAQLIYPNGRRSPSATLVVQCGEHSSGYHITTHRILIYVPCENRNDFGDRLNVIDLTPDKVRRPVSETELLHEMVHEMQYKELLGPTDSGRALFARFGPLAFSGPGHDESFYCAVQSIAEVLGMDAAQLVREI